MHAANLVLTRVIFLFVEIISELQVTSIQIMQLQFILSVLIKSSKWKEASC